MWVRLKNHEKRIEVHGVTKRFKPGDFLDVGKQTAKKWILEGGADAMYPGGELLDCFKQPHDGGAVFSIFCCPMSFEGVVGCWQNNAMKSWSYMSPEPEIIMCYDDAGVGAEAERRGAVHVPNLKRNDHGTPLISEIWRAGQDAAKNDLVCYVNSDVFAIGIGRAIKEVARHFDEFLIVGQRWDIDLKHDFVFGKDWALKLHEIVMATGTKLHGVDAIDWFAFRKGTFGEIPPFAIGRSAWDNWLILDCMRRGIPVIDATYTVAIVHQEKPITVREENWKMSAARLAEKAVNRAFYDKRRLGVPWRGTTGDAPYALTGEILHERR